MSRVQIVGGTTSDGFPLLGSVGSGVAINESQVLFVPGNADHYPPDCPIDEFEGYVFEQDEVEQL